MTRWKYLCWVIIGAALTLVLLFKHCSFVPSSWHIALDISAMFGSGIFCSTLVSWFIDAQNKKRDNESQKRQREYILATVKNGFKRLYAQEFSQFSNYHTKYISSGKSSWIKADLPINEIGKKLVWLIGEIERDETYKDKEFIIITAESIKRSEDSHSNLIQRNRLYYEVLHQNLLELSAHFTTYLLSGILTEGQIEGLKELTSDLYNVLIFSPDDSENDDTILAFKKLFFEKTDELITLLEIPKETRILVHYKGS